MTVPSSNSALAAAAVKSLEGLASAGPFSFWLPGKPTPTPRPRVSKKGFTYYPKNYKDWVADVTKVMKPLDLPQLKGPIIIVIEVNCIPPKKTDHCAPMGDVDNYAKGPMDLMTKLEKGWFDDRQVVSLTTVKRWIGPDEEPGYALWYGEIDPDVHAQRVIEGRPLIGD